MPAGFSADGDLGEWRLDTQPPEPLRSTNHGPPHAAAASRVTLAFSSTGVALAATLRGRSRDGLWIALRFASPGLLPIGTHAPGGIDEFHCDPEPRQDCAARAELEKSYRAAFRRVLQLQPTAARELLSDGSLRAVEGATVRALSDDDAVRVELALPLSSLPHLAVAPASSISVAARPASRPADFADAELIELELPSPVGFEPYADLRAQAFELLNAPAIFKPSYRYQPGEGLTIWIDDYPRDPDFSMRKVVESKEMLYTPQRKLGALEVGYMHGGLVGVLESGKPARVYGPTGSPRAIIERGGELHVIGYDALPAGDDGIAGARWTVLAIERDGSERQELLVDDPSNQESLSEILGETHAPDYASFGFSAKVTPRNAKDDRTITFTWRYDAAARRYLSTTTVHKGRRRSM
jgi:hypothetical protein